MPFNPVARSNEIYQKHTLNRARARVRAIHFVQKQFERGSGTHQSFLSAKTCTEALFEEAEARTFVLATTLVPTKEETAKDILYWRCIACACMRLFQFVFKFLRANSDALDGSEKA